jgi:hypothetical protein
MWERFGFEAIVFTHGDIPEAALEFTEQKTNAALYPLESLGGYRDDTIVQLSRLYAACVSDEYLVTGDIDMFPLSDYFTGQFTGSEEPKFIGYDITGYSEIPICYIGMSADKWRHIMNINSGDYMYFIERDLKTYPYSATDFNSYWCTDQQIITKRLKAYGLDKCTSIERPGVTGRICRSGWSNPQDHNILIDCHAMRSGFHPEYFDMNMDVIKHVTNGS